MGTINVYNVKDFGAYGNGNHNDTTSIQNAINSAHSNGGGIVYFPPGKYKISNTLIIKNKVQLLGFGGTTFDDIISEPTGFLNKISTYIFMDDNKNKDMIKFEGDSNNKYYQSGIENLVLYGNKTHQNSGKGIVLEDITTDNRSHIRFRNVLIYHTKGTGFYCGKGRHEVFFDEVMAMYCDGKGFELYGQDIKATRLMAGYCMDTGIKISGGRAGRYYDIDAFGNTVGIEVCDTMNIEFFGVVVNGNGQHGMIIRPCENVSNSWSPSQIQIIRGVFDTNSQNSNGQFSDVSIQSTSPNEGPKNITFIGCLFRGSSEATKPKHAIEDNSYKPSVNLISNCYFKKENYVGAIINSENIYKISNCFDPVKRKLIDEITVPYDYKDSNYELEKTDGFLLVSAYSGNRNITLPKIVNTKAGKIYYVSKNDSTSHYVKIVPSPGDSITGVTQINQIHQTLMVIHTGPRWYSIKIS